MESFVTIVSGLPRSGTSMMMRMLDVGGLPVMTDAVREADVDNPRGYYEFEPAKKTKDDPSWLEQAEGKAVKMVYQLLYDLPSNRRYRVLFMRRAMEEVLASQRKMLSRLGRDDGGIPDEKMAALFRSQLSKFEAWAANQPHLSLLDVDYNRMVSDPIPLLASINDFLGGILDTTAMAAVVEPDLYRNRADRS
ncbi:sulfotransferase family protein [Tautonia sociabilis]|uniref:Sulfotransferase family protein n=1 Tax=Tautonia sociabilis TaxID=2080755 RepID=A0A432MHC3_9BACT|nr:sulfotransferase family protein [Tautonia sociabilis]RUL86201.1 sulfotransferase family protein [Tautonia sociabilis]